MILPSHTYQSVRTLLSVSGLDDIRIAFNGTRCAKLEQQQASSYSNAIRDVLEFHAKYVWIKFEILEFRKELTLAETSVCYFIFTVRCAVMVIGQQHYLWLYLCVAYYRLSCMQIDDNSKEWRIRFGSRIRIHDCCTCVLVYYLTLNVILRQSKTMYPFPHATLEIAFFPVAENIKLGVPKSFLRAERVWDLAFARINRNSLMKRREFTSYTYPH